VGELHCPVWTSGGLGCNRVLEEEESTAVLWVGSDGDGTVWRWPTTVNLVVTEESRAEAVE
jgi:hypothetical protein